MLESGQLTGLKLERLLGKGAFANVYLCKLLKSSNVPSPSGIKMLAVKVLHPPAAHGSPEKAAEAESLLQREAEAMMTCQR